MNPAKDRLARMQRDLTEMRSRAIRIQGESDALYRQVLEMETELTQLRKELAL